MERKVQIQEYQCDRTGVIARVPQERELAEQHFRSAKTLLTGKPLEFSLAPERRGAVRSSLPVLQEQLGMRELYLLRQVHGAVVVTISDPLLAKTTQTEDLPLRVVGEGDALILPRNFLRNSTGAVGVRSADCVPLLLEVEGAVAAVHAGWRGLAVGVIPRTLQALREYGADLRVLVGPCADATHYAVGAEVPHQIGQDAVVTTAEGGELLLDLSGSAVRQIERQWPGSVSIVVSALGTISNPSLHSYRREGKGVGSNLSAICFR